MRLMYLAKLALPVLATLLTAASCPPAPIRWSRWARRWVATCASVSRIRCGPAKGAWRRRTPSKCGWREIVEGLGLDIASPDEAREILALKGANKVAF